jgi:putative ABC transport system substrate-binding protein
MSLCAPFIVAFALGVLAPPLAREMRAAKVPRIGILMGGTAASSAPLIDAFRQGLRDLGYVEGQNIAFERRYAEAKVERLPDLAAELVRLKVDAILVAPAPAIRAAKQATATIPIIMAAVADPLEAEFVASFARPGGNVTGVSSLAEGYAAKWLELLQEAVPKASRVAVLSNSANPSNAGYLRETQAAARILRVTLQPHEVRDPAEFGTVFGAMTKGRAAALLVLPDPMFFARRDLIVDLAGRSRLPAMYALREFVEAGGLMAYGADLRRMFRRAAVLVDKVLKGARPGDLPVDQVTRVELIINLKTAKALGITFPRTILVRAEQVIQ